MGDWQLRCVKPATWPVQTPPSTTRTYHSSSSKIWLLWSAICERSVCWDRCVTSESFTWKWRQSTLAPFPPRPVAKSKWTHSHSKLCIWVLWASRCLASHRTEWDAADSEFNSNFKPYQLSSSRLCNSLAPFAVLRARRTLSDSQIATSAQPYFYLQSVSKVSWSLPSLLRLCFWKVS